MIELLVFFTIVFCSFAAYEQLSQGRGHPWDS